MHFFIENDTNNGDACHRNSHGKNMAHGKTPTSVLNKTTMKGIAGGVSAPISPGDNNTFDAARRGVSSGPRDGVAGIKPVALTPSLANTRWL